MVLGWNPIPVSYFAAAPAGMVFLQIVQGVLVSTITLYVPHR